MNKSTNFVGCGHEINLFNKSTQENIKVSGHKGTWYVIERKYYENIKQTIYLCEHEQYGDETACVIIDRDYNLIMDDVWNGFDDYEEAIQWEQYKKDYMTIEVIKERKISEDTILLRIKFEKKEFDIVVMVLLLTNEYYYSFFYQGDKPQNQSFAEEEIKKYITSKQVNGEF